MQVIDDRVVNTIPSSMTQAELDRLTTKFPYLLHQNPSLPLDDQRANGPPAGKITVYRDQYDYGNYRFPPTTFLIRVLAFYTLCVSQLHPYALQRIVFYEMFMRAEGHVPSLKVFRNLFRLIALDDGWFNFVGRRSFAACSRSSIREWKFKFFYINSQVSGEDTIINSTWGKPDVKSCNDLPPLSARCQTLFDLCKDQDFQVRPYHDHALILTGICQFWTDQTRVPVITEGGNGNQF